jgi:uncharacterized membrane protein YkoI
MFKIKEFEAASIIALCVCGATTSATAYAGQELARDVKLTLTEATTRALKARPGKITDQELEHERGGSGLRYSFDIRSDGVTYEVGIDAQNGTLLENKREGVHSD